MKVLIPYFQMNPLKKKEKSLLILSVVLSLILLLMLSLRSPHYFDMPEMTLNIYIFLLAYQGLMIIQLLNLLILSSVIFILMSSDYYLFNIFKNKLTQRSHVSFIITVFRGIIVDRNHDLKWRCIYRVL